MPMHITSELKNSFTYNYDIAQAVAQVIRVQKDESTKDDVEGETFNIASEEGMSQYDLFYTIGETIGISKIESTNEMYKNETARKGMLVGEVSDSGRCVDSPAVEEQSCRCSSLGEKGRSTRDVRREHRRLPSQYLEEGMYLDALTNFFLP